MKITHVCAKNIKSLCNNLLPQQNKDHKGKTSYAQLNTIT